MSEAAPKIGRPTMYSAELADAICDAIIGSDQGLDHICDDRDDFPAPTTIYKWVVEKPEFAEKYTRAREAQGHRQADMALQDALNAGDASIGRLRWDARRWHASKLARKTFGDKVALTGGEQGDAPIRYEDMTSEERLRRIAELQAKQHAADGPRGG